MTEVWSKRRVLPFILILSSNGYEIATDKSFSLSNRKEIGARQLECFFERINRILNLSAQIKLLCLPIKSLPTRIKSEAIAEINFEKVSILESGNSNPWQTFGSILMNCNFDSNFFFQP